MKGFIVKLQSNCWLAQGHGDPCRTVLIENAKVYVSMSPARTALTKARKFRKLKDAVIKEA